MRRFQSLFITIPITFITGWFLTESLTVKPTEMFGMNFLLGMMTFSCLLLMVLSIKRKQFLLTTGIGILFFITGYLVKAKIYLSREDTRVLPEITRKAGESKGHTAIVYLTHGEPETFNPVGWLNQFREFDEQGVKFIPFFARPMFIYALRKKYLTVGKSNHRQVHMSMFENLKSAYKQQGDTTTKFYISFLDDEPRPDAAVIQALNDGAEKIIVATVFLTISSHTAEAQKMIEELNCEKNYNVKIRFSRPLWDSKTLMQAFVDKVNRNLGNTPKEKVGIAFIAHGQPKEWDLVFPTQTEQENKFRDQLIEIFVEQGFKKENLGKAWMEFKEPRPYELMQKFDENKLNKIFYFAASISADAIHSQSDIPELVKEYPFPPKTELVNLGAWNAHPLVIKAIKERIDEQLLQFQDK